MESSAFYGELVRRRIAGPFVVTESKFPGGSTLPTHAHDSPYFTFTLRGSYRERYGTRWRDCTPGTVVAHPACEAHSQVFDREPALLIRVAALEFESEREPFITVDRPAQLRSEQLARTAWQLHAELGRCDDYSDSIVEELTYALAGHALTGAPGLDRGSRKRALQAELLIRSSLRQLLPIAVLATELGVSRATLYRDFRSVFGVTPGEYLRQARIETAAALVLASNVRTP